MTICNIKQTSNKYIIESNNKITKEYKILRHEHKNQKPIQNHILNGKKMKRKTSDA